MEKHIISEWTDFSEAVPLLDEEFDLLDPSECEDHGENLYVICRDLEKR